MNESDFKWYALLYGKLALVYLLLPLMCYYLVKSKVYYRKWRL